MSTADTASVTSPVQPGFSVHSSGSRGSLKQPDDVVGLTSFNPFSEEDENDKSSYTLVTSLISRMKNTLSAPLSSATPAAVLQPTANNIPPTIPGLADQRRSSHAGQSQALTHTAKTPGSERPNPFLPQIASAAPPLVSLTPAQSEVPSLNVEFEGSPSRSGAFISGWDSQDGGAVGTTIPGFPIADDARSVRTSASVHRSGSVSKVIRRLRGEGLSRHYWMDDENCKECYDCKSVFTTWRRKHHCRICGQIFCSRCASNIIKGARFGQEGMVRVCNLCLEMLGTVDEDDDDRRSIVSSVNSFPAHQFGSESFSNLAFYPQSPYSASQIFERMDDQFNLYSIAESKRPLFENGVEGVYEIAQKNPAPFRRTLSDEEKDSSNAYNQPDFPVIQGRSTPVNVPRSAGDANPSSVQFPVGSPDNLLDSPRPYNRLRSGLNSYADSEVPTPFIRSRVHSRLDNITSVDIGWRTRRESTAYEQELNLTSMTHLKTVLRQMLAREQIPNIREWEETLSRLALRIARDMTFTALPHRQGEDMDIRRYVKIKKIPGGAPQDSEYVDGAVITKNVAHKRMSRQQNNPRIMLVTFPLEFHRVEGQYMQFGQIVRQEREYLNNLVARIAALRPHIVLIERTVSRLALDALAEQGIAVARSVKMSAITTIARMTQGVVFSSMDKLALEPRLGDCGRYRLQTFDHPLIPNRRKTYMRFEGCNPDMGCTVILRGADITTLRRLKKVTRFVTFMVRNLKLETHLWKDCLITLPSINSDAVPSSCNLGQRDGRPGGLLFAQPVDNAMPDRSPRSICDDLADEEASSRRLSWRIEKSLQPYLKTFISVSATLRFPPPYVLRRMWELDIGLREAKRAWEDEIIRREERLQARHLEEVTITDVDNGGVLLVSPLNIDGGITGTAYEAVLNPSLTSRSSECEPLLSSGQEDSSHFSDVSITATPKLPAPPIGAMRTACELMEPWRTAEDIHLESKLSLLKWQHEEHRRMWEWYLRKNKDDFIMETYQRITLWEYTVPVSQFAEHRPCFMPRLNYITFYGENDCTLGQLIEKAIINMCSQMLDPKATCTGKNCDQPLARHCQVYVHNETRLFVAVEPLEGQASGRFHHPPPPDLITTWSTCRVCHTATPFIPVSEEMQRYSFAKFLELHFYPADVKLVQGAGCEHNIYQHHVRYFAFKGMAVCFQTDPVTMYEIVYPPFRIYIRPGTQLELKNADYQKLHHRNLYWYCGLIDDLKLISIDAAIGDEKHDATLLAEINALIDRAEMERDEIAVLINQVYKESAPTDTLALNKVYSYRQEKIVAWQQDFDRLPKPRPLQANEKTFRRGSAFHSVRSIWPKGRDISGLFDNQHPTSTVVSEAEEGNVDTESLASEKSMPALAETIAKPTLQEEGAGAKVYINSEESKAITPDLSTQVVTEEETSAESDSTIGAPREDAPSMSQVTAQETLGSTLEDVPRVSKLPRRSVNQPTVAELVKKYQDFLPPQGLQDLAKTALPPRAIMSESEQEYCSPAERRTIARNKTRQHVPRKSSISDFEQGYAANIAPIYLRRPRRAPVAASGSRIPGPVMSAGDSHNSSRRTSPEKRSSATKGRGLKSKRPTSPPTRPAYNRLPSQHKEKSTSRLTSNTNSKSGFRRPPSGGARVSNITKHFERLSRDAERSKSRYNVIRGKRARPVTSARARVEILESVMDAIKDETDTSDISSEADDEADVQEPPRECAVDPNTLTVPATNVAKAMAESPTSQANPTLNEDLTPEHANLARPPPPDPTSLPLSPSLIATKQKHDALTPPTLELESIPIGPERGPLLKALSGFWPQQTLSNKQPIDVDDSPSNDQDYIFNDPSMIVRTDEPTSIIALALDSSQYRDMMAKSRAEKRTAREAKLTDGGEAFMPDDRSVAESTSAWGVVNVESSDMVDPTEELKMPSSKSPWVITIDSGALTISCTVLYPEQFDAFRRAYDCERSMIESLSRCVKWNASGGKSGSAFLKTRDDRFIAKELSRPELQTMETFAPSYFEYMSSAVSANRPTLLAKVFGCYKLTFKKNGKDKNSGKSKSFQMNLLVMENLFYDRHFTKIYDLKGSTRNRHVQSTGRANEVLLDENLVEGAHLHPFYLREHSKRILRGALYNDSKFLADINVMDYSLVVGVDSQKNELVVGIVDYQRTYTWDKKLESWVKESTFLGGRSGEPTIVTPKQYRQRFLSAMERYFPLIPDRWMKLKDAPEEESSCLMEL